jgi:predicted type IV restriction endonuclease
MSGEVDFKTSLQALARKSAKASERCVNEESTKMFLVVPFLAFLGYDTLNPDEVYPEHHADFSDKYKNRVDYAILRGGEPVVAVECKTCGYPIADDRGQLRSYFNAAKTIKLGVLTDGMVWEFYADSDEPNMMDSKPFLTFSLFDVKDGKVDDTALAALQALGKEAFEPENIGAEARKKHLANSVLHFLRDNYRSPSEEFTKIVLSGAGIGRFSSKKMEEYRRIVKDSMVSFINEEIIHRLEITERKREEKAEPQPTAMAMEVAADDGIITTQEELAFFDFVKRRLAFLVNDEALYSEIEKVDHRDYRGKFVIFYSRERKGRLVDVLGHTPDGVYRVQFPAVAGLEAADLEVKALNSLDQRLLQTFKARVAGQ